MAEYKQKEKFEGFWEPEGGHVKFSREWSGVYFSDAQCQALLAGEEIEFKAVSRAGKEYIARGALARQTFNTPEGTEREFIGFKPDFGPRKDASGREMPPSSWCGYTFTEDDIEKLISGKGVYRDDFTSARTGNTFACTVFFKEEEGRKKIVPDFGG